MHAQRRRDRRGGAGPKVGQDRCRIGQVDVADGVKSLRPGDVSQFVLAEIEQRCSFWQRVANERRRRSRHQDRPAAGERPDPGGPVHRSPEVIPVSLLDLPGVERGPHTDRLGGGPWLGPECELQCHCGVDAVAGPLEHAEGRVAFTLVLDHLAPTRRDEVVDQLVVAAHGFLHGRGIALPVRGRALDVREEDRPGHRDPHDRNGTGGSSTVAGPQLPGDSRWARGEAVAAA